ncbi:multidrug effflux MFS transporter [Xenorhabdus thuongxuanensis]|uniref:Bcr/CflA family efflux transporter n=1 Tax=Xenorhabdus thuongxuanensis TaxID=1873484 RepID=A0A1Q5U153_9GAMM|nr:multidrug effflux MFS transporter [Xenorhabdus thuongxuanensis]OKP06223.1 cmlA5 encodes chloramphenicol resistance [Xenorhabdus thuongxuanensis]
MKKEKNHIPIIVLIFVVLISPLGIDIYIPSLPSMADYYGISNDAIAASVYVFVFSLGVGQILVGPISDIIGRRVIALFGILLFLISSFFLAKTQSFEWLLTFRLLQGVAACCTSVAVFAVIRDDYEPEESVKVYSIMNASISIAPSFAPFIGGLLSVNFGWQSNFYLLSLYSLFTLTVVHLFWKKTNKRSVDINATKALRLYNNILKERLFRHGTLICTLSMSVLLIYVTVSPRIIIEELKFSEIEFSIIFGFNALFMMLIGLLLSKYVIHIGRVNLIIIGGIFMLIAGSSLLLITEGFLKLNIVTFMIPMIFLSSGFSILISVSMSFALEPFPNNAGSASAAIGFFQMIGASVISIFVDIYSSNILYSLSIILLILGGIGLIFSAYLRKKTH